MTSDNAPAAAAPVPPAPVTGHAEIDAALAGLELGPDVHTHPDALAGVIDVVWRALADPAPRPHP